MQAAIKRCSFSGARLTIYGGRVSGTMVHGRAVGARIRSCGRVDCCFVLRRAVPWGADSQARHRDVVRHPSKEYTSDLMSCRAPPLTRLHPKITIITFFSDQTLSRTTLIMLHHSTAHWGAHSTIPSRPQSRSYPGARAARPTVSRESNLLALFCPVRPAHYKVRRAATRSRHVAFPSHRHCSIPHQHR